MVADHGIMGVPLFPHRDRDVTFLVCMTASSVVTMEKETGDQGNQLKDQDLIIVDVLAPIMERRIRSRISSADVMEYRTARLRPRAVQ